MDANARIYGSLEFTGSLDQLGQLLRKNGLSVNVGIYAIRILEGCDFILRWEGNINPLEPFIIDAAWGNTEQLERTCQKISKAMTSERIVHELEIETVEGEIVRTYSFTG